MADTHLLGEQRKISLPWQHGKTGVLAEEIEQRWGEWGRASQRVRKEQLMELLWQSSQKVAAGWLERRQQPCQYGGSLWMCALQIATSAFTTNNLLCLLGDPRPARISELLSLTLANWVLADRWFLSATGKKGTDKPSPKPVPPLTGEGVILGVG